MRALEMEQEERRIQQVVEAGEINYKNGILIKVCVWMFFKLIVTSMTVTASCYYLLVKYC